MTIKFPRQNRSTFSSQEWLTVITIQISNEPKQPSPPPPRQTRKGHPTTGIQPNPPTDAKRRVSIRVQTPTHPINHQVGTATLNDGRGPLPRKRKTRNHCSPKLGNDIHQDRGVHPGTLEY